ncbi:MAG TPA: hypothetical protein VGB63_08020 [Pedobacter sp.]|jgi:hypothetical protein
MKRSHLFCILILSSFLESKAQKITITTIDSATHVVPDVSKAPWYGESSLGNTVVDTLRVVMVIGQVRTNTTNLNEGNLTWKKGYYINSKNVYLDINKKPISNLYRVFSTFPWW